MAVDFFLKLDTISGEATDSGHAGEIKLHSWSWGASQITSVAGSGGSGAGKAALSDLSIMKDFDKASTPLFQALLKGTHLGTATLSALKSAGDASGKVFISIELGEIYVTSIQASGSSEIPSESVSFSYNTIKVTYSSQDETGALSSNTPVGFDVKKNEVS